MILLGVKRIGGKSNVKNKNNTQNPEKQFEIDAYSRWSHAKTIG